VRLTENNIWLANGFAEHDQPIVLHDRPIHAYVSETDAVPNASQPVAG